MSHLMDGVYEIECDLCGSYDPKPEWLKRHRPNDTMLIACSRECAEKLLPTVNPSEPPR